MLAPRSAVASVTVTLNVLTNLSQAVISIDAYSKTGTDTTRLGGEMEITLDSLPTPTQAALGSFHLQALQPLTYNLDLGFGSKATAKIPSFRIQRHNSPAAPQFLPILDGAITATGVAYRPFGNATYKVTGLACTLLSSQGGNCDGTIQFENGPPNAVDEVQVKLVLNGNVLRATLEYFFVQPLDPGNPDLALVSGTVTAVAEGFLPDNPVLVALQASRGEGNGILLRWPKSATGFELYASETAPSGAVWTKVAKAPEPSGEFLTVTLPTAGTRRYFRLSTLP